jgi:GMC oxidoreductase
MTFIPPTYENFVSTTTPSQARLFPQYLGWRNDFDIVVVGSGMGGGVLADDLGDRLGRNKRILVLEAGSYLYPTHVFNVSRFPNADVARQFDCKTFWQPGNSGSENYIHERPQLNFGGRSIFWSGLIPEIQPWELQFFPDAVRNDLDHRYLDEAGVTMNESITMGATAKAIVERFQASPLNDDFVIRETPRALHQPYLARENAPPVTEFFTEPTGVFNTAELLINQAGLTPGVYHGDGNGMFLLLNHYVEDVQRRDGDRFELVVRNTLDNTARHVHAGTVVLAGGSIESPKLLRRSSIFHSLPDPVKGMVGRGLTDHPTTDWIRTLATKMGTLDIERDSHAKLVFYSRGHRDGQGRIRYPFNVEMNVNHEYWHLRDNDPRAGQQDDSGGASRVEIKFSFGNCLDDHNEVKPAPPYQYVPEIAFRNLNWVHHLAQERFPALGGWQKSIDDIWGDLNTVAEQIFSHFQHNGAPAQPQDGRLGQGKGFGSGTVHHAIGTLRMPWRPAYDRPFQGTSVVDDNLEVIGAKNLYVCDMSVMPFSSAANPVRTLVGLALRMSHRFG